MASEPSSLAGSAPERADQLVAIGRRLIGLIGSEIEAMQARRLDGASADWDEKERLSQAWRVEIGRIKADPGLLAGLDPQRRADLKAVSRDLERVLEGHACALDATRQVTEGLVRAIAGEVAASRSAPAGYGRSGQVAPQDRRQGSGLAVNAKV